MYIHRIKDSRVSADLVDRYIQQMKDDITKDEDFDAAEKVYREAYAMTGGASKKMEILFECLLMAFINEEIPKIAIDIKTCNKLVEDGADWDKKNKLKIFEGVYCMMIRDFKKASDLFVNSIATFTATEVMSF